ncbi:MFS transporter [Flavonifractor sp. An100]|uniref:MFS transporter n=1 Tax=Flavonifractor sp. An100 TaxID=1965538 RepID=UPI0031B8165B
MVTNRALLAIILAAICLLLSQLTLNGMAQYVFPDYYHSPDAVSLSSLLGNLAILALAFVATPLSKRYGKKEISIVGMLLSTVSLAVCFLLRPENVWVFTAFYVITYLGLGVFNTVIWACIVDVIDYGEVKNGVREDGTTYACYSFARKLGQAASSGLTGGLLSLVGYTELTRTDPAVLDGVFNITCVVPIVGFLLVALVLIFLYPLSKKVVEANSAELASCRAQ